MSIIHIFSLNRIASIHTYYIHAYITHTHTHTHTHVKPHICPRGKAAKQEKKKTLIKNLTNQHVMRTFEESQVKNNGSSDLSSPLYVPPFINTIIENGVRSNSPQDLGENVINFASREI